jgi:integrase
VAEIGRRYRKHLEALGRKRSTLAAVEMVLRVWIEPHLGGRALESVRSEDVEDMMRAMTADGVGAKSIRNYIGTLSALYRYAMHPRRRWATSNPCDMIDLPPLAISDEIRFLTTVEVDALVSAAVEGDHQALDRVLYLTAAMTGLRQGELIALRWQDVDWTAQRVRVRRNHVLGEFDTPKSRRSTRSVPMSRRVTRELGQWKKATRWAGQADLVFAEPVSGEVLRRGALMRRYRRALKAASSSRRTASTTCGIRSGQRWPLPGPDADAARVDGSSRHSDDAAIRRLCAERARGRDGRSGVRRSEHVDRLARHAGSRPASSVHRRVRRL